MKNKKFQYVISRLKRVWGKNASSVGTGFLLLEIMIALGAFAALSIMLAQYHVSIIKNFREANDYLQAVQLGGNGLDRRILGGGVDSVPLSVVGKFRIESYTEPFSIPEQLQIAGLQTERLKQFKKMRVNISWIAMDGSKRAVVYESAFGKNDIKKGNV